MVAAERSLTDISDKDKVAREVRVPKWQHACACHGRWNRRVVCAWLKVRA